MKINHEEYKALKELDDDLKWITRDESGELYVYDEKPIKSETMWSYIGLHMEWIREHEHLFHFIQWEDGEPHSIQELIHDYEYRIGTFNWATAFQSILHGESKETEVKKDAKWMNDELEVILDEMDELIRRAIDAETTSQTIEMLSGMTIEQVVEGFRDGTFEPKQELPVLPRYMHEWIMNHRDKYDLYPALKRLEGNPLGWERFYTWYRENTHTFVNAYLTGEYEVEEEQKYYVLDSYDIPLLERVGKQIQKTATELSIHEKARDISRFELTEQEIKNHDERYWAFAEPVEELEE